MMPLPSNRSLSLWTRPAKGVCFHNPLSCKLWRASGGDGVGLLGTKFLHCRQQLDDQELAEVSARANWVADGRSRSSLRARAQAADFQNWAVSRCACGDAPGRIWAAGPRSRESGRHRCMARVAKRFDIFQSSIEARRAIHCKMLGRLHGAYAAVTAYST